MAETTAVARQKLSADEIQVMERQDEDQILAAMEGAHLDVFVYDIEIHGRKVSGISYAGTLELARRRGNIQAGVINGQMAAPQIQDTTDAEGKPTVRVAIPAQDMETGNVCWGLDEEPKMMRTRKGDVADPKAAVKALSKAQRNAIRGLLPVALIEELLNRAKGQQRQGVVEPAAPNDTQNDAAPVEGEGEPCKCGLGTMMLRQGKRGPFLGCTEYRNGCRNTINIKQEDPDELPAGEQANAEVESEPDPAEAQAADPRAETPAEVAEQPELPATAEALPTELSLGMDKAEALALCERLAADMRASGIKDLKVPMERAELGVIVSWYNRQAAAYRAFLANGK